LEACKPTGADTASGCGEFTAIYAGPFESIAFNGNTYPVGVPVEIDEEQARLMQTPTYALHFIVTDQKSETPAEANDSDSCCG
jgi:hypothetical protein